MATMSPKAPRAPQAPHQHCAEMRARFTHASDHAAMRRYREVEFAGAQLEAEVASVRNGTTDSLRRVSRAMDEYSLASRTALHYAHRGDWDPDDASHADAQGNGQDAEDFEQTSDAIKAFGHRFDAEAGCYEDGDLDGEKFMSGIEAHVADIDRDLRSTGAYDHLKPHPRAPSDLFRGHELPNDAQARRRRLGLEPAEDDSRTYARETQGEKE